jgi:hypothetical protein
MFAASSGKKKKSKEKRKTETKSRRRESVCLWHAIKRIHKAATGVRASRPQQCGQLKSPAREVDSSLCAPTTEPTLTPRREAQNVTPLLYVFVWCHLEPCRRRFFLFFRRQFRLQSNLNFGARSDPSQANELLDVHIGTLLGFWLYWIATVVHFLLSIQCSSLESVPYQIKQQSNKQASEGIN